MPRSLLEGSRLSGALRAWDTSKWEGRVVFCSSEGVIIVTAARTHDRQVARCGLRAAQRRVPPVRYRCYFGSPRLGCPAVFADGFTWLSPQTSPAASVMVPRLVPPDRPLAYDRLHRLQPPSALSALSPEAAKLASPPSLAATAVSGH